MSVAMMSSPKLVFIKSKKPFRSARSATIMHCIKDAVLSRQLKWILRGLQHIPPEVPALHILKWKEYQSQKSWGRLIGLQVVHSRDFITDSLIPQHLPEQFFRIAGILKVIACALNVPVVNTVPCIQKYNKQIPRGHSPWGEDGLHEEV